ncbi:MAG: alpha/beta hydrolase [Anaerolineales bacterium]|uniref:Alpha/beta hydrolase n=1 Tax=Candidatus Desulfolinea nitratireducens TaxID=2841698 RepID=A0A8J6TJ11_9CHLR|nr:alpha/beta hydrolase [Candidatus Desulfolinea nitratireducens]MBL6960550.1 alpha/beta hydrolase [Anaerolineales bacterium]
MSVVLLEGAIVHYEVLGRGRPVIFLHGWVGSWRYWISSMQTTSTSFRAYALDLWGFGDTAHHSREQEKYSLKKQAALLHAFLEKMGIGKIALVGHGLGALVALEFASTYANIVDRVMIINCPLDTEKINPRLYTDTMDELVSWLSSHMPDAQIALADAKKTDPAAIHASKNGIIASNLFKNVILQHTPCLLVNGDQDPLVAQPSFQALSLLSDYGQHIVFDGAGYFPMLDSTAKFNRLLTDFLTLESGLSIKELGFREEWRRRVR